MDQPDITCVIPTFNNRVDLSRAVHSALRQAGVRVEVVLVDDCSDAQTRTFITGLAASDPRIRTFFLPSNGGQGQARNIGAAIARGRFLTFLDQDDEHAAGWYRPAIDFMNSYPELGALSGLAEVADIPERLGVDGSDPRVYGLTFIFVANIIFLRSVFLASGGFPTDSIWRSPIAGEDGAYRHGLAYNWNFLQCDRVALIHHAREGGATVRYLDRTELRDGKVVITHVHDIEKSGELNAVQQAFWRRAGEMAGEIRRSLKPLPAADSSNDAET
jgi:glycosyltransferase involved in cell wall biosynthesis